MALRVGAKAAKSQKKNGFIAFFFHPRLPRKNPQETPPARSLHAQLSSSPCADTAKGVMIVFRGRAGQKKRGKLEEGGSEGKLEEVEAAAVESGEEEK